MEIKNKVIEYIDERVELDHDDYYGYEDIRKKEVELLKLDLCSTISLLDQLDANHYLYIREDFDDLSAYFKSSDFIECMKRNAIRTGVDCAVDIELAIIALNA